MSARLLGAFVAGHAAALAGAGQPTCGCDCLGPCNCSVPDIGSFNLSGSHEVIDGPASAANFSAWLSEVHRWREKCLDAIGFDGQAYDDPAMAWTQSSYVQPQMHPFDRAFYSPEHGYSVKSWLDGLKRRYGGIDSALIWPGYPNMGADDRNQLDMIRSMPGFANGTVRAVIRQLHEAGVRVLWPYSPWDTGTRKEPGEREVDHPNKWWDKEWPGPMARFAKQTGADGYNLDATVLGGFDMELQYEVSKKEGHPVVVMPEGGGSAKALSWSTMGWCEGDCQLGAIPAVDLFKWLERRHMELLVDRWAKDRTYDIQWAWFNGVGLVSWENVWGTWNGITERDGEAIRRVATMLRYFGARGFLQSTGWIPHSPTLQPGVFASQWPLTHNGQTLWTLINRDSSNKTGAQLRIPVPRGHATQKEKGGEIDEDSQPALLLPSSRWYDCYLGEELHPYPAPSDDGRHHELEAALLLNFTLEAMGYGCVLEVPIAAAAKEHNEFLHEMRKLTAARPFLEGYTSEWQMAELTIAPNPPTRVHPIATYQRASLLVGSRSLVESAALPGMIAVPRALRYFNTTGTMVEGTDDFGVDARWPWEPAAQISHQAWLTVPAFHIDRYPVTKAEYRRYLEAEVARPSAAASARAGGETPATQRSEQPNPYGDAVPTDRHNWLKTWQHAGTNGTNALPMYHSGEGATPVVHVSLREARRYCHAHGKRLPTTVEWQYACQGDTGAIDQPYPWGASPGREGYHFPNLTAGRTYSGPPDVDAHSPQGDSSFGVGACLGHTWNYADELADAHTRSVVTVGSSDYYPTALHYPANRWYFPRAMDVRLHNKCVLPPSVPLHY